MKQKRFTIINLFLGTLLFLVSIAGFTYGIRLANQEFLLVFAFHGVLDSPEKPWEISYSKLLFYLDGLKKYGFSSLHPKDFTDWWQGKITGGRRFLITFDDGLSTSGQAMKKLAADRGISSAIFIVTDFVGLEGYLSWPELREIASQGNIIALHGKTHIGPDKQPPSDFESEIREAIDIFYNNLGFKPVLYAYPFGSFNQVVRDRVASSDLQFGFTIVEKPVERTQDRFLLPRIMFLRDVENFGGVPINDWIPPDEIRKSGLILTLSLLILIWSFRMLYRFNQMSGFKNKEISNGN